MNFKQFLNEQNEQYTPISNDNLVLIRQEMNRITLTAEIKKEYIDKSELELKIVESSFYLSGMKVDEKSEEVLVKGAFICEVTEDDGSVYFKAVNFEYNVESDTLVSIKDNDRFRDENWKNIQIEILKTSKKV